MPSKTWRTAGLFLMILLLVAAGTIRGGNGGLSSDNIAQFQDAFSMDRHTRAMYNAITNNDIKSLALNRDILQEHNEVFSHKIKARGITNQKSSGRCWLFAGLNVMRPAVIEKYKLTGFEFSQNYLAFWDKMEKANCFLEHIIEFRDRDQLDREMVILLRSPFPDGGWWKYVVDLIEKYGVVPAEVMPETRSSGNTAMMNRLIGKKLRSDAVRLRSLHEKGQPEAALRTAKEQMLTEVYRMLVMNLGEPPAEFPYRFEDRDSVVSETKMYTPREFYSEFVGVDLTEYVSLFNDPTKELDRHYTIRLSRNIYDGRDIHFVNVDNSILKEVASQSVIDDDPVWFACDVGKDQSREHGIMAMNIYDYDAIYKTDMGMTKAERVGYREESPNHAMVFVGVDIKEGHPVKWLVENSWGDQKGSKGYWTLYDDWFDNHVFNVIVKKKYVPAVIMAVYEQPPVVLPPWDPMFGMFRR